MKRVRRFVPLAILVAALAAFWASGLADQISWAGLARHQAILRDWVDQNLVLATALYMAIYATVIALSVPQGSVLTLTGGLLFGTFLGGFLAIIGATVGAILLFLVARSALGNVLTARGGVFPQTIRDGLRRDGFSYLLAIRLLPVFPFWLVNLGAALAGIRLLPYAAATLIGIAPATFVSASIGAGIGSVLATGGTPDLSVIFSLPVLGPLIALALLSLLPVLWQRWRTRDA